MLCVPPQDGQCFPVRPAAAGSGAGMLPASRATSPGPLLSQCPRKDGADSPHLGVTLLGLLGRVLGGGRRGAGTSPRPRRLPKRFGGVFWEGAGSKAGLTSTGLGAGAALPLPPPPPS